MQTLDQLFAEVEEAAARQTRAEIAREDAEWNSLSQSQRDARIDQSLSRFKDVDDREAGHDEDEY
jgi:hypothetical protein